MSAVLEFIKPKITKSEILYGISWEIYESLVKEYWNLPSPRLTYDSGILEVEMTNSSQHEEDSRNLSAMFELIAIELEIDFRPSGSTTFQRQSINKGFEPDSSFYIQSCELIEGKTNIGINNEFPPDLTIEVNRTSSSVPRMPIFAAFGVKEVWRFDGDEVKFYVLRNGVYLETEMSISLPILSSKQATEFLWEKHELRSTAWAKKVRKWVNLEKQKIESSQ